MLQFMINIIISVLITALGIMIAREWQKQREGKFKDRVRKVVHKMADNGELVIEEE